MERTTETFDERMSRFYHYMEIKGMQEEYIETCYGELRITVEALADYYDIASEKTAEMPDGLKKALWEDRLARIKKIQRKLEASIGYDRDEQITICQKKRGQSNSDVGEDALTLLSRKGGREWRKG